MEYIEEFTLEGKNFAYIDFSNCMTRDEFLHRIDKVDPVIAKYPERSLYTITNIENIRFDMSSKDAIISYLERNRPHVKFGAIFGLDGIKQVALRAIFQVSKRKNLHFAFTKEQAINWLLQQD